MLQKIRIARDQQYIRLGSTLYAVQRRRSVSLTRTLLKSIPLTSWLHARGSFRKFCPSCLFSWYPHQREIYAGSHSSKSTLARTVQNLSHGVQHFWMLLRLGMVSRKRSFREKQNVSVVYFWRGLLCFEVVFLCSCSSGNCGMMLFHVDLFEFQKKIFTLVRVFMVIGNCS